MTDVAYLPPTKFERPHYMQQQPLHETTNTSASTSSSMSSVSHKDKQRREQDDAMPSTPSTPPSRPTRSDPVDDIDESDLSELETPPRPPTMKLDANADAAGPMDIGTEPSKAQASAATTTKPKKAKAATASADPVQLKNGKLVLKQKPAKYHEAMSVLTAIVEFNKFCTSQTEPLTEIPTSHLPLFARLTQESDKTSTDLAKFIKSKALPSDGESQQSDVDSGKDLLPLALIESTLDQIADRVNYGLSVSDLASCSSKTDTASTEIPSALQLWRWEVRDTSLLQQDRLSDILARRDERRAARHKALELFNALQPEQQQALLVGKKKAAGKQSAAKARAGASAATATPPAAKDTALSASTSNKSASASKSASTSPSKSVSEAESKADSGVIIIDDEDEDGNDDADDEAAESSNRKSSPALGRRKSADSNSSPKAEGKPKKRAKLTTETPEQIAERERKDQERDEKRKVKEAKDAKRQKALEATKKSASLFSGFFNKKAASTTSSTPTAAGSPSKSPVAAAVGEGSTAASPPVSVLSDFERTFIPIAYKDLAPINRFARSVDSAQIDTTLASAAQSTDEPSDLLNQLRGARPHQHEQSNRSHPRRRRGIHSQVNVRETMRLVAESDLMTERDADEQVRKALQSLRDRRKVPVKLLQFATDLRPGWFGTWTRPSNMISGRKPLRQDPVALDYNYDSEAEWVDGEGEDRGEELEDENDDAEDAGSNDGEDSEMDDWLVDDLEEVEGEGEGLAGGADDDNDDAMSDIVETDALGRAISPSLLRRSMSPTAPLPKAPRRIAIPGRANKKQKLQQKKAQKQKRVKNSRRFTQKLVPVTIGPHWQEELGQPAHPTFGGYEVEFLNGAYPGLDPFTFVEADVVAADEGATSSPAPAAAQTSTAKTSQPSATASSDVATASASPALAKGKGASSSSASLVPNEHLSVILQAVEGSTDTKMMLQEKLALQFKTVKTVTKAAIGSTLTQTCERESKKADSPWRVKAEWRSMAGLS